MAVGYFVLVDLVKDSVFNFYKCSRVVYSEVISNLPSNLEVKYVYKTVFPIQGSAINRGIKA